VVGGGCSQLAFGHTYDDDDVVCKIGYNTPPAL